MDENTAGAVAMETTARRRILSGDSNSSESCDDGLRMRVSCSRAIRVATISNRMFLLAVRYKSRSEKREQLDYL